MERDWEVIRKILVQLEGKPVGQHLDCNEVQGVAATVATYHIWLLSQAGFVEARYLPGFAGPDFSCVALSMTWTGHELLDAIRSDTVWNKIKSVLKEKGIALSFEAVVAGAKVVIANMLGS